MSTWIRFLHYRGKVDKPGRNDRLDACLQLDYTDLSLLIQKGSLKVEHMGPPSEAIRLVLVVKRVQDL